MEALKPVNTRVRSVGVLHFSRWSRNMKSLKVHADGLTGKLTIFTDCFFCSGVKAIVFHQGRNKEQT